MNEKRWLVNRILQLLDLLENTNNQPIVRQIQGLLYELIESN